MKFTYCIMVCLAALTPVSCLADNESINSLDKSTLPQCQSSLALLTSQLQVISNILFYPPLVYNNKKYLISNFPYGSAAGAETYCAAVGGYLAQIGDVNEYKALQSLVLNSPVDLVLIGGSDAAVEETWIFPGTGLPKKFTDFIPGQPDDAGGNEDCLSLWKKYGVKMNDLPCGFRNAADRFMCEIPNNV